MCYRTSGSATEEEIKNQVSLCCNGVQKERNDTFWFGISKIDSHILQVCACILICSNTYSF